MSAKSTSICENMIMTGDSFDENTSGMSYTVQPFQANLLPGAVGLFFVLSIAEHQRRRVIFLVPTLAQ